MIRKPACPKYPTGVKKRVSGDWNCAKCTNLNFAFRSICNRCGVQKADSPVFHWAVFLTPPNVKDLQAVGSDDLDLESWDIPSLSPFLREKCMVEPTKARPLIERSLFPDPDSAFPALTSADVEALLLTEILAGVAPTPKPKHPSAGDWRCAACWNVNYSFRSECNRCHVTKSS